MRYFVRNNVCQLLPRKFKVAFTATDEDRAITGIHDLGCCRASADRRKVVQGFEIRTGGGTSIMPRVAHALRLRPPESDYLKVTEAMLRIFNRQEELRANRARARIKFLVDRIGIDEFRKQVDEELKGDWVNERDFDPEPLLFDYDEEALAPPAPSSFASPNGDASDFERLGRIERGAATAAGLLHRRGARSSAATSSPDQFRGLGQITREFTGGYARTSVQQNLVLRWIPNEASTTSGCA